MSTLPISMVDPKQSADPLAYYQELFDTLGEAYWDASDIASKDQIQGARDATLKIITGITKQRLEANTAAMVTLQSLVERTSVALEEIQKSVNKIIRNIETAGKVEAAIAKVLSLAGKVF